MSGLPVQFNDLVMNWFILEKMKCKSFVHNKFLHAGKFIVHYIVNGIYSREFEQRYKMADSLTLKWMSGLFEHSL